MSLLELCDPDPPSVTVEASVADGIRTMLDQRVGAVGVVDRRAGLPASLRNATCSVNCL